MAAPVRRTDPSLEDILLERPWDFDFFQAVRLLGLMDPEKRLIARLGQPLDNIVRFHAHLSMQFPPSSIQDLQPDKREGGPLHMTVAFMGLTGPQGVLPSHYTEYLIARSYSKDSSAAAFFDLFNHRLISLFYLAWEKHHFPIVHEREEKLKSGPKWFTQYLFDLIGMGTAGMRGRLDFPDAALLLYSGLIAQQPHSAIALEGMLRDYFRVPIQIQQFVGKWFQLEEDALAFLNDGALHNQLGFGAVAGDLVWNQQARFRVRVGPLNWERFNQFLPGGPALAELSALTRHFVNQTMEFEVQLVLRAEEVPWCWVSTGTDSPRLGLSSWLKTEEFRNDAGDLVMTVPVHPPGRPHVPGR
jgi:type VI secretion system protein ImpH